MKIKGVDVVFKELGFSVLSHESVKTMYQRELRCDYKVNLKVYERKLSNKVSLIVESFFEEGQSTYIYDFYKISYLYKNSAIDVKGSKMSPKQTIFRVKNYINYLERTNKKEEMEGMKMNEKN